MRAAHGVADTTPSGSADLPRVRRGAPGAARRPSPRWPTTSSTCARWPAWTTSASAATSTGSTTSPVGLEDVSKYPALFAELIRRGWTDADLQEAGGRERAARAAPGGGGLEAAARGTRPARRRPSRRSTGPRRPRTRRPPPARACFAREDGEADPVAVRVGEEDGRGRAIERVVAGPREARDPRLQVRDFEHEHVPRSARGAAALDLALEHQRAIAGAHPDRTDAAAFVPAAQLLQAQHSAIKSERRRRVGDAERDVVDGRSHGLGHARGIMPQFPGRARVAGVEKRRASRALHAPDP